MLDYHPKLPLTFTKMVILINQKQPLLQMFKLLERNQIFKMEENLNSGLMELTSFQWEKQLEADNLMLNIWLLGKIQRASVKMQMKGEMSISLT